ncbi:MAG: TIM-barrel domain-containing protein [Sumerlaeia bacterium]
MNNAKFNNTASNFFAALTASSSAIVSENPIVFNKARFTVITPALIRMEYSEQETFINLPSIFAVERNAFCNEFTMVKTPERLEIQTQHMRLIYKPNGNPFSKENLEVYIQTTNQEIRWHPEIKQTQNLGGTISTLDQIKGPVDLGEGILSRDGWYLLNDSNGFLLQEGWVAPRPADAGTDYYLFGYGIDYKLAFASFIAISGPVPLPRKSVLGSWYSRWWHYSTEDYKAIVQEYQEHDFPLDIIVMDMEWHTGDWTGWSWNYALLPDPPALLRWFHEQGLTVTLNVHPSDGIRPEEAMYKDFMLSLGADPNSGETISFDAGNQQYMNAYFTHTHTPREKEGVDFWWLDWQQYEDVLSHPGLKNLTWLNKLYFDHSKQHGKRGLQFSRWGGWGDHRNPIHFSGDADTGWAMLGFEVPFTSTAGNVGAYYWSHDIGGHFGDRNEEPYTRWVQFSATTAAMRLHSGIIEYLDRRPWMWPEWATTSMRKSFHLRSRLMPYIYCATRETNLSGIPLNRPMYIDWPAEEEAYDAPQQYMFGGDLLVAPIASKGFGPNRVASQLVWFPEGQWNNMLTNEVIHGPQWRLVSADVDEFPLYVQSGVPVPMQPYSPRPTTQQLNSLELHVWASNQPQKKTRKLYEDDGISSHYEQGEFAYSQFTTHFTNGEYTLKSNGVQGSYNGQPEQREYKYILHQVMKPTRVTLNEVPVDYEWDSVNRTAEVIISARSIREGFTVSITADLSDSNTFAELAFERRLAGITGKQGSNMLEALSHAANSQKELVPALVALAGLRFVENETHYPEAGLMRRLILNSDSIIQADGVTLTWKRTLELSDETKTETSVQEFNNLQGKVAITLPQWGQVSLKFLDSLSQELQLACTIKGEAYQYSVPLGEVHGQVAEWFVSAYYPFDTKKTITEQRGEPELMSLAELKSVSPTTNGWVLAKPDEQGFVDLLAIHKGDNRLAYAVSTFTTKAAGTGVLGFRSDDGIEVWLNGTKIHSANVLRGINHDWEEVPVVFSKGENVLLLKVTQAEMAWGFMVRGRTQSPKQEL